jgi:hypothetical protein
MIITGQKILIERRSSRFPNFDATPCSEGTLDRLDLQSFRQSYRPKEKYRDRNRADRLSRTQGTQPLFQTAHRRWEFGKTPLARTLLRRIGSSKGLLEKATDAE